MKKTDWRQDIKDHDTLYDLDPAEIMVFLRHQYLDTAKNLAQSNNEDDRKFSAMSADVACLLQEAIQIQFPTIDIMLNLDSA